MFKSSKKAFTLAEVLITLGIIGVVAAMTMPTLLNSTQGAQYRTAFKKTLSVLSQAVVLNIALDDYDLSQTGASTIKEGTNEKMNESASVYNLFKNRTNVISTDKSGWEVTKASDKDGDVKFGTSAESNFTLFFNDGTVFTFPKTAMECAGPDSANCKGAIDVNGDKNPNRVVKCESGSTDDTCVIKSPTDVYPVIFYGQTVLPNSVAARAVMYSSK